MTEWFGIRCHQLFVPVLSVCLPACMAAWLCLSVGQSVSNFKLCEDWQWFMFVIQGVPVSLWLAPGAGVLGRDWRVWWGRAAWGTFCALFTPQQRFSAVLLLLIKNPFQTFVISVTWVIKTGTTLFQNKTKSPLRQVQLCSKTKQSPIKTGTTLLQNKTKSPLRQVQLCSKTKQSPH